jgi:hypothetical protein
MARWLPHAEAAGQCAEAARLLSQKVAKETTGSVLELAGALAALTQRLESAEAARLCAQAAEVLNQLRTQQKDATVRWSLAEPLAAVAVRLEPSKAVTLLNEAVAREKDGVPPSLAQGLATAAGQLAPAETLRACVAAARLHAKALDQFPEDAAVPYVQHLSILLQSADDPRAADAARVLARLITSDPDSFCFQQFDKGVGFRFFSLEVLERCLTSATRPQVQRRALAVGSAMGLSAGGPGPGLPLLAAAGEPLPCRLPTQDLVDLLKMPTCVAEVRQVILTQLGNRYGRSFDTHWDFVRYAQEQQLDLDFTTPPKRPDRKLSQLFAD